MRVPLLLLAAASSLILTTSSTYAQATPPAATATAAPAATSPVASASSDAGDGTVKAIRQACRQEADGEKLKGEARMKAVSGCVVKKRPDLAQREQCRMDGWQKGLRKDELKSFVKDCAKAKG